MTDQQTTAQPIDTLMTSLNISNADLVKVSKEQLTFKMVNKGRGGRRISPNVQEKILNSLLTLKPDLKLKCRDLFHYEASQETISQIKDAMSQSKSKKLSYPQFIDALLVLGVVGYKAEVGANRYTFYIAGGECYIEQGEKISEGSPGLYNKQAIALTLKDIQAGKIDHTAFLKRIYEAGIVTYEVNIRHRYIRYMGLDHSTREDIPTVEEAIAAAQAPATPPPAPKKAEAAAAIKPKIKKTKAKTIKNKKIGMTRKQRNTITKIKFRKRRPTPRRNIRG